MVLNVNSDLTTELNMYKQKNNVKFVQFSDAKNVLSAYCSKKNNNDDKISCFSELSAVSARDILAYNNLKASAKTTVRS